MIPTAVVMGLIFGAMFQKSHVYEPIVIRSQFIFARWIMLKMFLAAVGMSMLVFSFLMQTRLGRERLSWVRRAFAAQNRDNEVAKVNFLRAGLGAGILG